jgi:hypothetical protein
MMMFTQWLLREMGHVSLDGDAPAKKPIIGIDLMLEKYPKELNAELLAAGFASRTAFGKIPNSNDYLIWHMHHAMPSSIEPAPPHDAIPLPADWWTYAHVVFADGTEKLPGVK